MKVISGTLKGRNIKGYNIDGTRPTMDRVKESLFGMIQDNIKESTVLDLFSGPVILVLKPFQMELISVILLITIKKLFKLSKKIPLI